MKLQIWVVLLQENCCRLYCTRVASPAFCKRLADGAELETDRKNCKGFVLGWILYTHI